LKAFFHQWEISNPSNLRPQDLIPNADQDERWRLEGVEWVAFVFGSSRRRRRKGRCVEEILSSNRPPSSRES
jgi:hypothetical protein